MTMATLFRAAILSALPFAAMAQDSAHWGGSSVTLKPAGGPAHVADVVAVNRLTGGHALRLSHGLTIPGLSVVVDIAHGPGSVPDTYTVTVPDGFIAVPAFVVVPEDGQAVIRIFRLDEMQMGSKDTNHG